MNVFVKLTRTELKLQLREPVTAFFSLLFPTILVIILGSIPAFRKPSPELHGGRTIDVYVGIAVALSVAMLGLQVLPMVLAAYRESGVLRRIATTPVRPITLLAAQMAALMVMSLGSAALTIAVGFVAFDVPLAGNFAGFVLAYLLCAAGVFAIGLLIAALAPTGKAGNAIGTLLFFPSMFFAGLWTPREFMPGIVQKIGDYTPMGAGERALHDAMTGHWPNGLSAAVLIGYLAVFGLGAARLFRWN
ncbi:ABC transporter [Actinoplanes sp. SE50]|uniref:ABC transporter permease n=1 Tax=unclassified Actinoplanes TaxID=2626549 RepID=UPI00023EBFB2|nr:MULTISPECIES: ABC transporter permease [unclassified Actinoplanes]AEV87462.1 Putative pleiotropic drug resistance protein 7 [Actinoplanes sp. SE50/110]ATO85864.1 ABC transporter [Actinoplanes sp. SE50]SLM03278.1 ABC transporter [Actinoplanes sp. SE50/110]